MSKYYMDIITEYIVEDITVRDMFDTSPYIIKYKDGNIVSVEFNWFNLFFKEVEEEKGEIIWKRNGE